jgi:hypothetical protein
MKTRQFLVCVLGVMLLVSGCGEGASVASSSSGINSTAEGNESGTESGNVESSTESGDVESSADLEVVEVEEANEESWDARGNIGHYRIVGYIGDGKAKKVYIPETINGEPVSIMLDLTEESIGNIEELVIPSSVKGLQIRYTGSTGGIKRITFSDGFTLCDLENDNSSLFINNPFEYLEGLEEITIDGESENFYTEDGILFQRVGDEPLSENLVDLGIRNTNCIVCYPASKEGESYTQPDGVQPINGAYMNTKYLKKLTNVFLSGDSSSAFAYSSIEEIENAPSTTLYDHNMYWEAENLKTINISADYNSSRGGYFLGCTSLEQITVDDGVTSFYSDDGVLYSVSDGDYYLIKYPAAREGETYTLLENTKGIYIEAFESVKNLKTLIVPSSSSAECLGYQQSTDSISKDCDFEIVYE